MIAVILAGYWFLKEEFGCNTLQNIIVTTVYYLNLDVVGRRFYAVQAKTI
jgi:hypothetical protein